MIPLSKDEIKAAADRAEARAQGKTTTAKEFASASLTEGEQAAEIAKLAALPVGVYESKRVAAAERLSMRTSILDKLVAAKRPRDEKRYSDCSRQTRTGRRSG